MYYRVYDTKEKEWLNENIYMNPKGELFSIKRSVIGVKRFIVLSPKRYIYHKSIGLVDKNNKEVFEGDYIKANVGKVNEDHGSVDDKIEVGLVVYASDLSSYVILCTDSNKFYGLGSETCEFIEVIGNVFDGYEN